MPNPGPGHQLLPHLAAGLTKAAQTVHCTMRTPPKDFSSANPVLPGPVWVTQKGPARSGVAAITYLELAGLQGKILSPCSPLRTQVTNALLRACISGTPDGTQRQQVHDKLKRIDDDLK